MSLWSRGSRSDLAPAATAADVLALESRLLGVSPAQSAVSDRTPASDANGEQSTQPPSPDPPNANSPTDANNVPDDAFPLDADTTHPTISRGFQRQSWTLAGPAAESIHKMSLPGLLRVAANAEPQHDPTNGSQPFPPTSAFANPTSTSTLSNDNTKLSSQLNIPIAPSDPRLIPSNSKLSSQNDIHFGSNSPPTAATTLPTATQLLSSNSLPGDSEYADNVRQVLESIFRTKTPEEIETLYFEQVFRELVLSRRKAPDQHQSYNQPGQLAQGPPKHEIFSFTRYPTRVEISFRQFVVASTRFAEALRKRRIFFVLTFKGKSYRTPICKKLAEFGVFTFNWNLTYHDLLFETLKIDIYDASGSFPTLHTTSRFVKVLGFSRTSNNRNSKQLSNADTASTASSPILYATVDAHSAEGIDFTNGNGTSFKSLSRSPSPIPINSSRHESRSAESIRQSSANSSRSSLNDEERTRAPSTPNLQSSKKKPRRIPQPHSIPVKKLIGRGYIRFRRLPSTFKEVDTQIAFYPKQYLEPDVETTGQVEALLRVCSRELAAILDRAAAVKAIAAGPATNDTQERVSPGVLGTFSTLGSTSGDLPQYSDIANAEQISRVPTDNKNGSSAIDSPAENVDSGCAATKSSHKLLAQNGFSVLRVGSPGPSSNETGAIDDKQHHGKIRSKVISRGRGSHIDLGGNPGPSTTACEKGNFTSEKEILPSPNNDELDTNQVSGRYHQDAATGPNNEQTKATFYEHIKRTLTKGFASDAVSKSTTTNEQSSNTTAQTKTPIVTSEMRRTLSMGLLEDDPVTTDALIQALQATPHTATITRAAATPMSRNPSKLLSSNSERGSNQGDSSRGQSPATLSRNTPGTVLSRASSDTSSKVNLNKSLDSQKSDSLPINLNTVLSRVVPPSAVVAFATVRLKFSKVRTFGVYKKDDEEYDEKSMKDNSISNQDEVKLQVTVPKDDNDLDSNEVNSQEPTTPKADDAITFKPQYYIHPSLSTKSESEIAKVANEDLQDPIIPLDKQAIKTITEDKNFSGFLLVPEKASGTVSSSAVIAKEEEEEEINEKMNDDVLHEWDSRLEEQQQLEEESDKDSTKRNILDNGETIENEQGNKVTLANEDEHEQGQPKQDPHRILDRMFVEGGGIIEYAPNLKAQHSFADGYDEKSKAFTPPVESGKKNAPSNVKQEVEREESENKELNTTVEDGVHSQSTKRKISFMAESTITGLKEVSQLASAFFNAGWSMSKVDFMRAFLLVHKYQKKYNPNPRTNRLVLSRAHIKTFMYFVKYDVASYGSLAANYFGHGRGFLRDTMRPKADSTTAREILGIPKEDLLVWDFDLKMFKPMFFISRDRALDAIVVSIRGTFNLHEIITDAYGEYAPFSHGHAHHGFLKCAQWLEERYLHRIKKWIKEYNCKRLYLTGHSMGGGIASLLTMIFKSRYAELVEASGHSDFVLKCYNVATPPCVNEELCSDYEDCIETVVHENDVIPRLSYGSILDLRDLIYTASRLLHDRSLSEVDRLKRLRLRHLEIKALDLHPKVYIPGKVYYVYKTSHAHSSVTKTMTQALLESKNLTTTESNNKRRGKADREITGNSLIDFEEPHYLLEESDAKLFSDVQFKHDFFYGHFLNKYDQSLTHACEFLSDSRTRQLMKEKKPAQL